MSYYCTLQVQKLLVKHNISPDGDSEPAASTQSHRRCPISNESLQELYEEFKDTGKDYLDSIAEQLPVPATAKQVKAWLKTAGVLKAAVRKRREIGEDGAAAAARPPPAAAGGGERARVGGGGVAEPQPMQLLGYLEALHRAHADSNRCVAGASLLST